MAMSQPKVTVTQNGGEWLVRIFGKNGRQILSDETLTKKGYAVKKGRNLAKQLGASLWVSGVFIESF